jgi:hypothetical protein
VKQPIIADSDGGLHFRGVEMVIGIPILEIRDREHLVSAAIEIFFIAGDFPCGGEIEHALDGLTGDGKNASALSLVAEQRFS